MHVRALRLGPVVLFDNGSVNTKASSISWYNKTFSSKSRGKCFYLGLEEERLGKIKVFMLCFPPFCQVDESHA